MKTFVGAALCVGGALALIWYASQRVPLPPSIQNPTPAAAPAPLAQLSGMMRPPAALLVWNVQAEQPRPETIAQHLRSMWAEVVCLAGLPVAETQVGPIHDELLSRERDAIFGESGEQVRLAIAWDTVRFDRQQTFEPKELYGIEWSQPGAPAPLMILLKDTSTQRSFWVVNHDLTHLDTAQRAARTSALTRWAEAQTEPVIALGDFEFENPPSITDQAGTSPERSTYGDGVWHWVCPSEPVKVNWSVGGTTIAIDERDRWMDLAMVAGAAKTWDLSTRTIATPGRGFTDADQTSRHLATLLQIPR